MTLTELRERLTRPPERWAGINPHAVAEECSRAHIENLLRDAQKDLAVLFAALDGGDKR